MLDCTILLYGHTLSYRSFWLIRVMVMTFSFFFFLFFCIPRRSHHRGHVSRLPAHRMITRLSSRRLDRSRSRGLMISKSPFFHVSCSRAGHLPCLSSPLLTPLALEAMKAVNGALRSESCDVSTEAQGSVCESPFRHLRGPTE